jgi:hypothetical protein
LARIHGRRGRIYLEIASGGSASPLPFIATWSINHTTDKADVTAMGDDNKTYVAGLADANGAFSGFLDNATAQTYTAAIDGLARKFYLYPDLSTNTLYWFGTILVDMSIDGGVASSVNISSNWNAASTIAKVG